MLKKALFMCAVFLVMPGINGMECDDLSRFDETDWQNLERLLSDSQNYYGFYQQHKNYEEYAPYAPLIKKYEESLKNGRLKRDEIDVADFQGFIHLVEYKDMDDYMKDAEWFFKLARAMPYAAVSTLCMAGWYYYG